MVIQSLQLPRWLSRLLLVLIVHSRLLGLYRLLLMGIHILYQNMVIPVKVAMIGMTRPFP